MDFEKISINNNDFYQSKKAILANFVPSCPEKAKEEIARFRKIVDTVMNVPAGRETLMAVAKQQPPRKFGFETFTDKAGCFTGDKILLNPNVSDKLLPATLVHEATHSLQNEHNPAKEIGLSAFTAESQLKIARAMEADAFAKEAMFIHQCDDYAPEIYDAEMKLQNKTLDCFNSAVENGATQEEALRKAALYDQVIFVGGLNHQQDLEGQDRPDMKLPYAQDQLILELLKAKRKGNYNIIKIDPEYRPAEAEKKQVFGITFEQKRNDVRIDDSALENIVTESKELGDEARLNLITALITLKYTQSNSVCFAYDGQAIGVGAGQQSRIHCTRLAGDKADTWFLRQSDRVLELPFRAELGRAERDNIIDGYINKYEEDVCAEGIWQKYFTKRPEPFTNEQQRAYLDTIKGATLASDAFFPFADSIERAAKSGVSYIAEPGGSIRDDLVIQCADRYNMTMIFNGIRLFHH